MKLTEVAQQVIRNGGILKETQMEDIKGDCTPVPVDLSGISTEEAKRLLSEHGNLNIQPLEDGVTVRYDHASFWRALIVRAPLVHSPSEGSFTPTHLLAQDMIRLQEGQYATLTARGGQFIGIEIPGQMPSVKGYTNLLIFPPFR